jgi:hypothetical protein
VSLSTRTGSPGARSWRATAALSRGSILMALGVEEGLCGESEGRAGLSSDHDVEGFGEDFDGLGGLGGDDVAIGLELQDGIGFDLDFIDLPVIDEV